LLAVIGFFPTEARGAIGGLDYSKEERQRLAKKYECYVISWYSMLTLQIVRSIGWICPVCEVNTKDALSDTPSDIDVKRDELPNFMITYKPTTEEKESPSQSQTSSSSLSLKEKAPCTDSVQTSTPTTKSDELANYQCKNANDRMDTDVQPQNEPTSTDIMSSPQSSDITPIRTENSGSPIWLDALIAGLVSFICVLICRKYLYPF
jgi:hypothetical protein